MPGFADAEIYFWETHGTLLKHYVNAVHVQKKYSVVVEVLCIRYVRGTRESCQPLRGILCFIFLDD